MPYLYKMGVFFLITLLIGSCIMPSVISDTTNDTSSSIPSINHILSSFGTVGTVNSFGTTLYVGGSGPGNYSSIQDAIDDASDGYTIFVYSGTYYENVEVDKSITLEGENKETTVIDGGGNGDVVYVSADSTTITGFTIQNSGDNAGIYILSYLNKIINNIITRNYYGVVLIGGSNSVSFNIVVKNDNHGIFLGGKYNIILGNTISENKNGILFSSYNEISSNFISENEYGLKFGEGLPNNNNILSNVISNNLYGFFTSSKPDDPTITTLTNKFYFNNFIDNRRYVYYWKNEEWNNNYWSDWIGLKYPQLNFLPYYIPGTPNITLGFLLLCFNFDWNPAREPYDM